MATQLTVFLFGIFGLLRLGLSNPLEQIKRAAETSAGSSGAELCVSASVNAAFPHLKSMARKTSAPVVITLPPVSETKR